MLLCYMPRVQVSLSDLDSTHVKILASRMKLQPKDLVKLIVKKYCLENPIDPTEEQIRERLRMGKRLDLDGEEVILIQGFIEYHSNLQRYKDSRKKVEGSFRET